MLALTLATLLAQTSPTDAKIVDLKDGFVRVSTAVYSIEVPKGWAVSRETSFGQRKVKGSGGDLGVMTAGRTQATWDELYRTSLYFIMRDRKGKATPYQISKTDQGYEACSFTVLNEDGFADRRFVLLKNKAGDAIALDVQIRDPKLEKELAKYFERMVKSARIL